MACCLLSVVCCCWLWVDAFSFVVYVLFVVRCVLFVVWLSVVSRVLSLFDVGCCLCLWVVRC